MSMAIHKMSRVSGAFGMVLLLLFTAAQVMGSDAALYGWFFSGGKGKGKSSTQQDDQQDGFSLPSGSRSHVLTKYQFDIDAQTVLTGGIRGKQLYEKASLAQKTPNTCWVEAYVGLAASCRDILRDETKKSRMALRLTDCFLKTSGRPTLKKCPENWRIQDCVKSLDDHNHAVFLAFFIDSAAMCHYLQSQEFKLETEALVNELKVSAHYTEHKLGSMSQQLEEQHNAILERSEHILEIQKRLQMEHALLQESIEGGMGELQEAANEAQQQLDVINKYQKVIAEKQQELSEGLQSEFQDLQRKSNQLGSSMTNLHGSVEDLTEKSTAGQEEAIRGLSELQRIQIEAMQESRHSVKSLVEQAQQHQSEFRGWQSELDKMHHRLVDGTTHMIKAQETFVTKQAAIFTTMEKLFSLHNSILVESRAVKTLMLYFALSIFVYMATTTKQTQSARVLLYFGLFLTLTFEIWLIRFRMEEMNHKTIRLSWPPKQIVWLRYSFGGMALAYLLYTYVTFKDYDFLNYTMLKDIHGRFGKQSRLQEQLLQEYLARCEICKDLPQPNGHSTTGHRTLTQEGSFKDDQNSHESFEEKRAHSTLHRTKKSEGSTSRSRRELASKEHPIASSPIPRPRKRASGSTYTTGSARTTGSSMS